MFKAPCYELESNISQRMGQELNASESASPISEPENGNFCRWVIPG